MAIQDPVMHLDEELTPDTAYDKNEFFAFVFVFPIRQDNFVDKYLNINLKTGIAVKICFLSTIPQLLCFF
jgi:hypothetical protein